MNLIYRFKDWARRNQLRASYNQGVSDGIARMKKEIECEKVESATLRHGLRLAKDRYESDISDIRDTQAEARRLIALGREDILKARKDMDFAKGRLAGLQRKPLGYAAITKIQGRWRSVPAKTVFRIIRDAEFAHGIVRGSAQNGMHQPESHADTMVARESTREKALNTILWFYRRAKPTYGRLPFAEDAIALLQPIIGGLIYDQNFDSTRVSVEPGAACLVDKIRSNADLVDTDLMTSAQRHWLAPQSVAPGGRRGGSK